MNRTQAQQILDSAQELLRLVQPHVGKPKHAHRPEAFGMPALSIDSDGYINIKWSRYVGCGEYEREEGTIDICDVFQYEDPDDEDLTG